MTGSRVQSKYGGHFGMIVRIEQGHSFTIRYDPTLDDKGRKIRGSRIQFPWHRLDAFNII